MHPVSLRKVYKGAQLEIYGLIRLRMTLCGLCRSVLFEWNHREL